MNIWLAVFLGGGAGSIVRFAISQFFQRIEVKGAFPWATLSANLLATAFLAWLIMRFEGAQRLAYPSPASGSLKPSIYSA